MPIDKDITPSNWMNLFPGADKSKDRFFAQNFITFTAHDSPKIQFLAANTRTAIKSPGGPTGSYSFFYPENSIREEIKHNYGETESTFLEAVSGLGKTWSEAVQGYKEVKSVVGGGLNTGVLIEPPIAFKNTERRSYDINLTLYTTKDIVEDVYKPIRFFKKHSHATEDVVSGLSTNFTFPNVFTISGAMFDSNWIKPVRYNWLVLTSMSIEYNSGGMQFVDTNGLPVSATLALHFEALSSLMSGDFAGDEGTPRAITQSGGE